MNSMAYNFAPRMIPAWIKSTHCTVPVTCSLMLGTVEIQNFEAVVTVYREEDGNWGVGEIEVEGWRGKYPATVTVKQDRGETETLAGFFADAVFRELENPKTIDAVEEALAKAEQP